jgi:hypothetical protein
MMAKVLHELTTSQVLHRMSAMVSRRREMVLKLIKMWPKVEAMMPLTTRARIIFLMPEFKLVRCDEGYHTWIVIGNFVDLNFKSCA